MHKKPLLELCACQKIELTALAPFHAEARTGSNNRSVHTGKRVKLFVTSLNPFNSTDQPVNFFIGIVKRQ